ncbi:MAG: CDP-diacylglycerol--serine O-phosphatidyltransferase [Bdellovibrio sp.]|nr:CDP-diacylglycerol--serine O-phosphatidyltransferase [Bdellovibrio sp.]
MTNLNDHSDIQEGYSKAGKKLGMYIYVLPNLMTTANLFCGFFSIVQSIQGDFKLAAYAVVAAAIFDLLDGRLARLTHATSKFGAEYDSLCDLVSFGLAPGLLMFQWAFAPFGRLGWLAAFLYVACTALRLARFNVQVGVVEKNYFQGLPSPMAAGIVASSYVAFADLGWAEPIDIQAKGLLFMVMLLGIVMVSNFRYRSFKDLDLKERLPFKYLIIGVIIIFIVALRAEVMLFVLFLTYAILGAVFGILRIGKKQKQIKASVYAPAGTNENDLQEEDEQD